jgi:putrescine aminotransferase
MTDRRQDDPLTAAQPPGFLDKLEGISERKRRTLTLAHEYMVPHRVETFVGVGVPLVIGKREGYRIWDIDGHELLDLHLNGGTYNLGHRNPEALSALTDALADWDIGNHHFPSEPRALLAEKLAKMTPGELHYTVFAASGSEANDVAIKSARYATGRRKVACLDSGFHGSNGLSGAAGNDETARWFHSDYPDDFVKVPFNDLDAMEQALRSEDVAAVLIETIPATAGFVTPQDGYLEGVKALCERYGTLYIADEVQTGLGRTGKLWAVEHWGIEPDILVTGKGLSAGLYPIAAVVMTREVGAWLKEKGWGYVSTFGGAEIGCLVASTVLDICGREGSLDNARSISEYLGKGLADLQGRHPFFKGVRRNGLVMGLEFDDEMGGILMSSALYRHGLWAMFAGFDFSVLQFKPGLLVDESYCDLALAKLDAALSDVEKQRAAGR